MNKHPHTAQTAQVEWLCENPERPDPWKARTWLQCRDCNVALAASIANQPERLDYHRSNGLTNRQHLKYGAERWPDSRIREMLAAAEAR